MTLIAITPLENWIKRKIGLKETDDFTREALSRYQLRKLQEALRHARSHSPFYRHLFAPLPHEPLQGLADLSSLPFTTADDLCDQSLQFLCVSQSDVARVVTVQTWEARPKRLHFTEEDLELSIDFFHHGMSGIVQSGQRALILMPGETPGSAGDLLVQALARMDVQGIVHGFVQDPARTIQEIIEKRMDCLVGIPVQVLALARHADAARIPTGRIKRVLLSSDYVPQSIVDEVTRVWKCRVFEHYGMTEMGLGGGVQCSAHMGYHFREADLFFETIDPGTGQPVPDGEIGEIVFTTLTRKAMPLIRYRTGDLARFIPGPCPCGTVLKRMDRIEGRLTGAVVLDKGHQLSISDLDDVVFSVPGVLDYQAAVHEKEKKAHLELKVHIETGASKEMQDAFSEALSRIQSVKNAVADGSLVLDTIAFGVLGSGAAKRKIVDRRVRN